MREGRVLNMVDKQELLSKRAGKYSHIAERQRKDPMRRARSFLFNKPDNSVTVSD